MEIISQTDKSRLGKSGIEKNTITMGLCMFGQNIRITSENGIPNGHSKISKNLGSQKIQLQWASIFVAKL